MILMKKKGLLSISFNNLLQCLGNKIKFKLSKVFVNIKTKLLHIKLLHIVCL